MLRIISKQTLDIQSVTQKFPKFEPHDNWFWYILVALGTSACTFCEPVCDVASR